MFNKLNKENYEIDYKGINNLRGLAIDMINNANSGHPGICLGAAGIVYMLFKYHMNIYLDDLNFKGRDRFVFSAGHGAPLFYGVLYMLNLLTLDDLKKLRKLNSKTPGHPEYLQTPLVEMSTGPLGQGVGTAVGMAVAEAYLNKLTNNHLNYYTYVLCGDGEMEEGITYEALSLAGTLNLNKLIVLYDGNDVTLDNNLKVSSCEDVKKRFESINFNVITSSDDPIEIDEAISNAKSSNLPTIIIFKTRIGAYSKNEGLNIVHGKPLDDEDIFNIKEKLDLYQTPFTVSNEVCEIFYQVVKERGEKYYKDFLKSYQKEKNKKEIDMIINNKINSQIDDINIDYNNKSLRDLSGELLNLFANNNPLIIGGSADLSSSCKTNLYDEDIFYKDNYLGRNIYFGIREHAMGAILNGMALSGLRPFGSTFLTFSDYMKPAIRMSAFMNLPVLYIFTHDSITVGEDGPMHHPIEQLAALELIPNLKIYRPFDLNELIGSYQEIFENNSPSVLILPRDNKQILDVTKITEVKNGMYIIKDTEGDDYINLVSNGEELGVVLEVSKDLESMGISSRVISVPCLKNIKPSLKNKLKEKRTIAITLQIPNYFYELTNEVIGISEFSKSGSKEELLDYFGFTKEKLLRKLLHTINE